jgi:hypothetical protein
VLAVEEAQRRPAFILRKPFQLSERLALIDASLSAGGTT